MRVLIQRVKEAKVETNGEIIGKINNGLLIFVGVGKMDGQAQIDFLVDKIANLRIFEDTDGKMNLSAIDLRAEALIVSQFTLYADCQKGRRPSFTDSADPRTAEDLYKKFILKFKKTGLKIEEGKFGAVMDVSLVNWGPVTIWMERN